MHASTVALLAAAKGEILARMPDGQRAAVAKSIDNGTAELLLPWFRFFLRYDPRPTLERVHVPVLALDGSLDRQVTARENLAAIDTALCAGGNHDYRTVELPGLNHLFQSATTGAPTEYATIDETIAPAALDLIASWIDQRFGTAPSRHAAEHPTDR